jgi:hypothetical protein
MIPQTKTTTALTRGQHSRTTRSPSGAVSSVETKSVSAVQSSVDDCLSEDDRDYASPSSFVRSLAPHIVLSELPISAQRLFHAREGGKLTRMSRASGHGWEDYSLRIVTAGAVTTSAGGVVANAYSADPSNLSLVEWSSFAALFDEVKLQSFELSVCSYSGQSAPAITSIAMGSFLNKGSVPSTILSVLLAPDGKLISPNMVAPTGCHLKAPPLGYAPTTSPAGTTAYGCPGYIHLYATGVASTAILTYVVVGRYHLRGRM